MQHITFEVHTDGAWREAATLLVHRPAAGRGGPIELRYDLDYAFAAQAERVDQRVSWSYPASLMGVFEERWPRFLDDLLPGGAARIWWERTLGIGDRDIGERDWLLLRDHTGAPIGNVRVASAKPSTGSAPRFPLEDIVEREPTFLDEAYRQGVSIGGATGAGGEAPKLLLRRGADGKVWIDSAQTDTGPDAWMLVKFARNRRGRIDADILRAEAANYRVLARLGLDTIDVNGLEILEPHRVAVGPSLWMPRFDVTRAPDGTVVRHGVESLYALLNREPGARLSYWDVLGKLNEVLCQKPETYTFEELAYELIRRDLLHILLGNTDNHGRNMAVLRTAQGMRLAPMYDVAPMCLDPEMVVRSTRWVGCEDTGLPDYRAIVARLEGRLETARLWERLRTFAATLEPLAELLLQEGAPESVVSARALRLDRVTERLAAWGFLE